MSSLQEAWVQGYEEGYAIGYEEGVAAGEAAVRDDVREMLRVVKEESAVTQPFEEASVLVGRPPTRSCS